MHSYAYADNLTVHVIVQCTIFEVFKQAFSKLQTTIEHACVPNIDILCSPCTPNSLRTLKYIRSVLITAENFTKGYSVDHLCKHVVQKIIILMAASTFYHMNKGCLHWLVCEGNHLSHQIRIRQTMFMSSMLPRSIMTGLWTTCCDPM